MHNQAFPLLKLVVFSCLALLLSVACGPSGPEATNTPESPQSTSTAEVEAETEATPADESGYPGPDASAGDSGYPAPPESDSGSESPGYPVEGVQSEPPNPERNLPSAEGDNGVVGGVLVREITDQGYLPVTPRTLLLADVIFSDDGEAAFIRQSSNSPQAELFQTGVFIFEEVAPGSYGLVADMGFGQLPVLDAEGATLSFDVEAGEALDLGQVFVRVPGD